MKRYACHRLYVAGTLAGNGCRVVELGEGGAVVCHYPLAGEQGGTLWLGGVILLAAVPLVLRPGGCWTDLLAQSREAGAPLYAWHVTGFDLLAGELTAGSRLVRL